MTRTGLSTESQHLELERLSVFISNKLYLLPHADFYSRPRARPTLHLGSPCACPQSPIFFIYLESEMKTIPDSHESILLPIYATCFVT